MLPLAVRRIFAKRTCCSKNPQRVHLGAGPFVQHKIRHERGQQPVPRGHAGASKAQRHPHRREAGAPLQGLEGNDTKEQRKAFYDQIATLDNAYPGGLKAYLASARDLLAASAKGGANPLKAGRRVSRKASRCSSAARRGSKRKISAVRRSRNAPSCSSRAVSAKRLGYSRIKVELPTETASATKYLEYYVKTLLALATGCLWLSWFLGIRRP